MRQITFLQAGLCTALPTGDTGFTHGRLVSTLAAGPEHAPVGLPAERKSQERRAGSPRRGCLKEVESP